MFSPRCVLEKERRWLEAVEHMEFVIGMYKREIQVGKVLSTRASHDHCLLAKDYDLI